MKIISSLVLSLLCTVVYANQTKQIVPPVKNCQENPDPSGCLLQLGRIKASTLKDPNQRASAFSKLLEINSWLKRTDYELVEQSSDLLKNKNLRLENYFDLGGSLAAYYSNINPAVSKTIYGNLINKYYQKWDDPKFSDKASLFSWSCDLVFESEKSWKLVLAFVTNQCNLSHYEKIDEKDIKQKFLYLYSTPIAAWLSGDLKKVSTLTDEYQSYLNNLDQIFLNSSKTNDKSVTQQLRILNYGKLAELYNMAELYDESEKNFKLANEALIGMYKIPSNGNDTYETAVMLADYHSSVSDYKGAISILEPIQRWAETELSKPVITSEVSVEYLAELAFNYDRGGFNSYYEELNSLKERGSRPGQVLFQEYLLFKEMAKTSKNINDEFLLEKLTKAAEAGNVLAMHDLAVNYNYGEEGAKSDQKKSFYWYFWSALEGFSGAQNNLGDLYEKGVGSNPEIGNAIYWYTQAAMQGEPTAYLSLGELFLEGKGVQQNYITAGIWLTLAEKNLPDGANKADAKKLKDESLAQLTDKDKRFVYYRALNFIPLKPTENTIGDKPRVKEAY